MAKRKKDKGKPAAKRKPSGPGGHMGVGVVPLKVEVPDGAHRIVVRGMEPRMQVFNLPHEIYCKLMGKCYCTEREVAVAVYSKADVGRVKHLQKKMKRMNSTLTVRYRERVAVSKAALACPEVASAKAKGWLRVVN